jgi:hypothetical protein
VAVAVHDRNETLRALPTHRERTGDAAIVESTADDLPVPVAHPAMCATPPKYVER